MKFHKIFLLSVMFFLILISGCEFLEEAAGLSEKVTDVTVKSVEPLTSSGELTGVRVVFENKGTEDVSQVRYCLLISDNPQLSTTNDFVCYESNISIAAESLKQLDIGEDPIGEWVEINAGGWENTGLDNTTYYYLGAIIDSNDYLTEDNELNNEGVSTGSFLMGGGGDESSLTVQLSGGIDDSFNDKYLRYGIYHNDEDPEYNDPVAYGEGWINSNYIEVEAKDYNDDSSWHPYMDEQYDVYFMIDIDNDEEFTEYLDYSIDNHIDLYIDEDHEWINLNADEFFKNTLPGTFGVYSETHDAPINYTLATQDVSVNEEYSSAYAYDGSVVIRANFSNPHPSKLIFSYPYELDISDSESFVLYINKNIVAFESFQVGIFSSNDITEGTYVSVSWRDVYSTGTDMGPGGYWDEYTIPLSLFSASGFITSELNHIDIINPVYMNSPITSAIEFDNIYFKQP